MADLIVFEVTHPNHPPVLLEAESPEHARSYFLKHMGIIATSKEPTVQEATPEQVQQLRDDMEAARQHENAEAGAPIETAKVLGRVKKEKPAIEETTEDAPQKTRGKRKSKKDAADFNDEE